MRHGIFFKGVLEEIGVCVETVPWFCDNRSAIYAASKAGFKGRTKHVDVKLKCTREFVEEGFVKLEYVPTTDQLADILTKRPWKPSFVKFVDSVLSWIERAQQ